jgi:hypothetical protein
MERMRRHGPRSGSRSRFESITRWALGARHPRWPVALLLAAWVAGLACSKAEPEVARTTLSGERCLDDEVACGNDCTQLASSAEHCGACDVACDADSVCDRGRCTPASTGCSDRLLQCGGDCVDPRSDRDHCGECGNTCPDEGKCQGGGCTCPGALIACGDVCANTQSDERNCGGCGQSCFSSQSCEAGSCVCPANTELCGEACVNTQSDALHCGSCGNACAGGQVCDAGSCECPAGQTLCNNLTATLLAGDRVAQSQLCVDTQSSAQHCGACGNACVGGQVCDSGSCACPAGQTFCDGVCVDTQSDAAHCGSCSTRCGLGQGCAEASCQSGALGEDGCQGLAQNISITDVAAYQTVKVSLAQNGQPIQTPDPALVAKRQTLFRTFVTPGQGWVERELSARLFLETGTKLSTLFAESTLTISAASTDANRASTFEFQVAPELLTDETRLAVELVECGAGSGQVASPRFPATDGFDLRAVDTGGLKIRIIPLRSNNLLPDISEQALGLYRAAFLDTYPISSIDITLGDPVDIADPEDWNTTLDTVRSLRQQQQPAADVYYYGMIRPSNTLRQFCGNGCTAGVGFVPGGNRQNPATRAAVGLAYADSTSAFTMLHEVAHNHGRQHAPCVQGGTIAGVDPNFPQADGSVGIYGYDALGDQLLTPQSTDLMGYCRNQWLSAYTYEGILNTVMTVNQVQASVLGTEPESAWRVLLVDAARGARWGKSMLEPVPAFGEEEPALVLDASGAEIATVSVFRTKVSDLEASSIQVPEPQPGWDSIQVVGAPPVPFRHSP